MGLPELDRLWIYRRSGLLDPLACYEIRDAAAAILGRAVEEKPPVWLLALKVTRMRLMTPLTLRVEDAAGFPVFSLVRSWGWWAMPPVEVQNAVGVLLLRLRSENPFFLLGGMVMEDPFLGPIGRILPLQRIALGDRLYEVQDLDGHSVASFRWIRERIGWPPRWCEIYVERSSWRERWPFAPLAAALTTALWVEAR